MDPPFLLRLWLIQGTSCQQWFWVIHYNVWGAISSICPVQEQLCWALSVSLHHSWNVNIICHYFLLIHPFPWPFLPSQLGFMSQMELLKTVLFTMFFLLLKIFLLCVLFFNVLSLINVSSASSSLLFISSCVFLTEDWLSFLFHDFS